jgi:hypothetical protein
MLVQLVKSMTQFFFSNFKTILIKLHQCANRSQSSHCHLSITVINDTLSITLHQDNSRNSALPSASSDYLLSSDATWQPRFHILLHSHPPWQIRDCRSYPGGRLCRVSKDLGRGLFSHSFTRGAGENGKTAAGNEGDRRRFRIGFVRERYRFERGFK